MKTNTMALNIPFILILLVTGCGKAATQKPNENAPPPPVRKQTEIAPPITAPTLAFEHFQRGDLKELAAQTLIWKQHEPASVKPLLFEAVVALASNDVTSLRGKRDRILEGRISLIQWLRENQTSTDFPLTVKGRTTELPSVNTGGNLSTASCKTSHCWR